MKRINIVHGLYSYKINFSHVRYLTAQLPIAIFNKKLSCCCDSRSYCVDVRCSCRPLSGIAVVSMSIYFFTYLQFRTEVWFWCLSAFSPFVAKRYILQHKCLKKWIGSPLLETWRQPIQLSTPTPEGHNSLHIGTNWERDRQTDRRQCHSWQ